MFRYSPKVFNSSSPDFLISFSFLPWVCLISLSSFPFLHLFSTFLLSASMQTMQYYSFLLLLSRVPPFLPQHLFNCSFLPFPFILPYFYLWMLSWTPWCIMLYLSIQSIPPSIHLSIYPSIVPLTVYIGITDCISLSICLFICIEYPWQEEIEQRVKGGARFKLYIYSCSHAILVHIRRVNLEEHGAKVDTVR